MANKALGGKPYAGNPHVRIDEGHGASVKPRRSSSFFKRLLCGVVAAIAMGNVLADVEPYTCHWTGNAKNGSWWDTGNWAEGVVPGVYTAKDANDNVVTNGCRGCTAVFGRVANNSLDNRRCIHANPYTFNADAEHCLLSIGNIVFDAAVDPDDASKVLPEYVFSNNLSWQWGEPYLPLEGDGSIELKPNMTAPVYFDTSLTLGAHETAARTYHFINNSQTTLAFHRLTANIGSVQWSKAASAASSWLSHAISFEGSGDIVMMHNGSIPRSNQEYSWRLAMNGGRVLVRKAPNLPANPVSYSKVAAQTFQLLVPPNVGQQVLDIAEECSLEVYCDNSAIVNVESSLKISGDGLFHVHSGTSANREFYVRNDAKVEIACTITNKSSGTFAGEKAGLRLLGDAAGAAEFKVAGTNAVPGAVQVGAGVTYVASTVGNVGEFKELGAGQKIQFDGAGVLKYTGAGEKSTKLLRAQGLDGMVWNAGTGDLFFAGMTGVWSDYRLVITNDGIHAVGFTGDITSSRPIVAPGALVAFAPPEGQATATINVTNILVRGSTRMAIADGTTVRIYALRTENASAAVDILMNESGGARIVIDHVNNSTPAVPGMAPTWIRLNGSPARLTANYELAGLGGDDVEIAARGDTVPNAPGSTVAITSPGEGEKDTLAENSTSVLLLRNRETAVSPVVELGAEQTFSAGFIDGAAGATPLVFTGAGDFGEPFALLAGTVVRSNETSGASFAVKAEAEADVTLTGFPGSAPPLSATVCRGVSTLSGTGGYDMNILRIDGDADVALENVSLNVTNTLRVGQTGTAMLTIEDGVSITGTVKVAGFENVTASLVQNGGDLFTKQKGNPIVGYCGHGYYELNGGRIVNFDGGGTINVGWQGTAVFAQNGGEIDVESGAFQVRSRSNGYSVFHQKAGLLWQSTPGSDVYLTGSAENGAGAWIIDGPNAVTRVRSAEDGRNFVLGGAYDSTGGSRDFVLAVNNGGTIHAGSIVATKGHYASVRALVNFDGGVFRNNYAYGRVFGETGGTWFDPVDRVTIFKGGMTMQADVNCTTKVPIDAPTGKGVASIAWTDTATQFIGAPAVRIAGNGYGATAVAEYDSSTRKVTGIRVTSPGCDYTEAEAEILHGNTGGASKVVARIPCVLQDNVSGGFRKTGNASFTFSVTNTYTGATIVESGSIVLGASDVINSASALVLNGGTLNLNGHSQTFSDVTCNGGGITGGRPFVSGLVVDFDEAKAGRVKHVDTAQPFDFAPGASLTLLNYDPSKPDKADRRYTLVEFTGAVPQAVDFSQLVAPAGWAFQSIGNKIRLVCVTGTALYFR